MAGSDTEVTAYYAVRAAADPHTIHRLLGLFAQQEMIPSSIQMSCDAERIDVAIAQGGIDRRRAQLIAEKMRSQVMTRRVELRCVPANI